MVREGDILLFCDAGHMIVGEDKLEENVYLEVVKVIWISNYPLLYQIIPEKNLIVPLYAKIIITVKL